MATFCSRLYGNVGNYVIFYCREKIQANKRKVSVAISTVDVIGDLLFSTQRNGLLAVAVTRTIDVNITDLGL